MDHLLKGQRVALRTATRADRKQVFTWLTRSDLTSSMMGPPNFPDNPVPTWMEFINDYFDYFFDGSQPAMGRCFIIEVNGAPVGQINYNDINPVDRSTELDLWAGG